MGLDEASARAAAEGGIALAKEKIRRALYRTILTEGLGREGAAAYAKSYGFSDEEASAFGDYAEKVNGKASGSETVKSDREPNESYTDYLRRRLKEEAEKQ